MQGNSNQTFMTSPEEEGTVAPGSDTPPTALSVAFENAQRSKKRAPSQKKRGGKSSEDTTTTKTPLAPAQEQGDTGDDQAGELFKRLIEARKASEIRLKEQEAAYAALLAIGDMGDTAEDMVRQVLYRRLVAQGSPDKLEAALKLLDEQEAALIKRLGMPPRKDHGTSADTSPIEDAADRHEAYPVSPPQWNIRKEPPASPPPFEQGNLHDLIQSAESYFRLYQDEPGHDIRMQHIRQYFRDPARINEFLAIHTPSSWARQFQYLYDNIIIPSSAYAHEEWERGSGKSPGEGGETPASTEELIRRNMDRMGL